jgi:catechol 2,3-dioxygenase-like lactoylglutathione lyase family enzyme
MLNHIALITILTDDVPRLAAFYRDALGFAPKQDLASYVEFHAPDRFCITPAVIPLMLNPIAAIALSWPFRADRPAKWIKLMRT